MVAARRGVPEAGAGFAGDGAANHKAKDGGQGRARAAAPDKRAPDPLTAMPIPGKWRGVKAAMRLDDNAMLAEIPDTDFDWSEWKDGTASGKWQPREAKVQEGHIREVFGDGASWMSQKEAAERLQAVAEVGWTTAYDALKLAGRAFSEMLTRRDVGKIGLA